MYQSLIKEMAPDVDPRWVEAWMRVEHGTLEHLSLVRLRQEVIIAAQCAAEATTEQNEMLAVGFGL